MLQKIKAAAVLVLIAFPLLLHAQNDRGLWKQAVKEYKDLKFVPAVRLLKQVLEKQPDNIEAKEMLASSYKNIKDYKEALNWYEQLCSQSQVKPEWALNYAEVLANNEQYEKAEQWYRKYLQLASADKRAAGFASAYTDISTFMKDRQDWKIDFTNINTSASEYSPAFYKNGLIFSTNRNTGGAVKRVFEWDQTPYSDLYYIDDLKHIQKVNVDSVAAKNISGAYAGYKVNDDDTRPTSNDSRTLGNFNRSFLSDTSGKTLSSPLQAAPLPGKVNSIYHEGPAAELPDGSLIFTRNNYYKGRSKKSSEGINKLKLFTASGENLDKIEPFPYNSDEYSAGHPAVNKAGTLLIFASDMPGGIGGTDLYYCTRNSLAEPWGKPVNMGNAVNTVGDELFPTLDNDETLFFSSTGHPGLGGLDIFQIQLKGTQAVGTPLNLGAPVNSSVDDFALIRTADGKSGYFSSNRLGSDDIYSFTYHPFIIALEGVVLDAKTGKPISGSQITLNNGAPLTADAQGRFRSVLNKETDYKVAASMALYSGSTAFASSKGIKSDTTLRVVLKLDKKAETPHDFIRNNCDSLKQVFAVENIYYDLDKSFIRKDAVPALTHLISLMKAHPQIKVVASSHCDSRASHAYNVALSLRRSKSAKNYLVSKGIAAERIYIEYHSEDQLVNNCKDDAACSEANHQLNRRTEFYILMNGLNLTQLDCK